MESKSIFNCIALGEMELLFSHDEEYAMNKQGLTLAHEEIMLFMCEMYERANQAKSRFECVLDAMKNEVTSEVQLQIVNADLKKPKRLLRKASENNGLQGVGDIVRGSVVCDNENGVTRVLKYLSSNASISIHQIHDGFKDLDFMHYRCLVVMMSIKVSPQGQESTFFHPVELQLHLRKIHELLPSCETPRDFFLGQGGLAGDEKQRMADLKTRMDVVHAIGATPVLLSVFLMYIKACTSKLSDEERDEATDVQTCPPMPPSLHFLYQEALWGALESHESNPSDLLGMLERIAFENLRNGT